MRHRFARLGPIAVTENQDGLPVLQGEVEGEFRPDPIRRTVDAASPNTLRLGQRLDLHHHLAYKIPGRGTEGEGDFAADL